MHKVPKIRNLHRFAISQKNIGDDFDFLPVDKHDSFLQIDSINLGVHRQTCLKYPK